MSHADECVGCRISAVARVLYHAEAWRRRVACEVQTIAADTAASTAVVARVSRAGCNLQKFSKNVLPCLRELLQGA
jgi:hypothetical protein